MSLEFLVVLVVVGVLLVVALVHWTGGSRRIKLDDEEKTAARFLIDFPDFIVDEIYLSNDHNVALLLDNKNGEAGVVAAMGLHCYTRMMPPHITGSVKQNGNLIEIDLNEMIVPRIRFLATDEQVADKITYRLARFGEEEVPRDPDIA